jgi:hypothetical protein
VREAREGGPRRRPEKEARDGGPRDNNCSTWELPLLLLDAAGGGGGGGGDVSGRLGGKDVCALHGGIG